MRRGNVSPEKGPVTEANQLGKVTERAPHAFPLQGPAVCRLRPGPAPHPDPSRSPQQPRFLLPGPSNVPGQDRTAQLLWGPPLGDLVLSSTACTWTHLRHHRTPYPDPPSLIPPLLGWAHLTE